MNRLLSIDTSKFHPLISPEEVSFQPLTLGWYLVACLLIMLVFVVLFFLIRAWSRRKYRRVATRELLTEIRPMLLSDEKRSSGFSSLSVLMRQVAIHSYSRELVAGLYENKWIEFLNNSCRGVDFSVTPGIYLSNAQYQSADKVNNIPADEIEKLIKQVRKWIGGHHV